MEESRVVEDEAIVRQMMTTFERLPLFDTNLLDLTKLGQRVAEVIVL